MNDSRTNLRRRLIATRRALQPSEQIRAAERVAAAVVELLRGRAAGTVSGYLAYGGELDPGPALEALAGRGWQTVVPVCRPGHQLDFCPWRPGDRVVTNTLGVDEPLTDPIDPAEIDAMLVPGVGFDETGARIGHGVGYYDRFFARCAESGHEPLRIGVAHDVQMVELPEPEPWDVPMQHLVTPTRVISP